MSKNDFWKYEACFGTIQKPLKLQPYEILY